MSTSNTGFLGELVSITDIVITGSPQGPVIKFRALFEDAEGVVHAESRHSLSVDSRPDILAAARELNDACRRAAEHIHFRDPKDSRGVSIRGIAEAIGAADAPDEPGSAG